MPITITVNGRQHSVNVDAETPLLYVLRNDLNLKGVRFGCGLGQCGACVVVVGDKVAQSCSLPISEVLDEPITTIEGLGDAENPHPLQAAFIAEQAIQCGFCASGILMTAFALLGRNPNPSEDEIRNALDQHLCRCGTNARIIRAIQRASRGVD